MHEAHSADIDRLYALPREEFTPQRDELAKRLREEGDRDGAAAVKALRKPTIAAWAVNQVQRDRPDEVRDELREHVAYGRVVKEQRSAGLGPLG